jgi:hypothetical protein
MNWLKAAQSWMRPERKANMAMRMRRGLAISILALAASACATSGEKPATPRVADTPSSSPAPSKPAFRVRDVMGKSAEELDKQFGAPALVRREGPGEFRRYALKECSLIVILYPDDNGQKTAGFVDSAARAAGAQKPDLNACLARG